MRLIACGSRHWTDAQTVGVTLARFRPRSGEAVLVHGACRGADMIAARVAFAARWTVEAHPADWHRHGKAAGPIRNQEMIDAGADLLVAFGDGRGTEDCVRRAEKAGIAVFRVPVESIKEGL